jgi:serine/threonine-protein kinase RsbW
MSESVLADLKLAVTEVCGNAVRHAYGDAQGEVHVVFDVSPEAIDVTVEDDGHGMHLEELPDAIHVGEEPVEAGMGLAIIRAVVDDLSVDGKRGAAGTVVRLRKRLSA